MHATLIFSALGFLGLVIVGIAVKTLYLNVEKVPANAAVRVMSSIFAVFVMLIGATLAGLALSYALTKEWHPLPHFMLLACLCGLSIYLQLKPARKMVAAAAQAAPARVEPTADSVTGATAAVAPASAAQPVSSAPVVAASAVAATTAAAVAVDEASLPDVPAPAVISAVSDDVLDSWTPEEDEVAAPVAQSTLVEPVVASEVVDATPVPVLDAQSALEMPAPADIEELAAVQPEATAAAAPSSDDEAADVLDLNGVTQVSDAPDTVIAEQRVDVVEPASDNEVARPVVAAPSEISVAVA